MTSSVLKVIPRLQAFYVVFVLGPVDKILTDKVHCVVRTGSCAIPELLVNNASYLRMYWTDLTKFALFVYIWVVGIISLIHLFYDQSRTMLW